MKVLWLSITGCSTLQHRWHVCGWTRPVFWLVWMEGNGLLSPQCSYISSPYSPAAQMAPAQCSHFYSLHHSYNSAKCKCATHYEHHNSHTGFIKRKRVEVEETSEALGPEQALKLYVLKSIVSWTRPNLCVWFLKHVFASLYVTFLLSSLKIFLQCYYNLMISSSFLLSVKYFNVPLTKGANTEKCFCIWIF